jgi:hypothetical protein
MADQTTPPAPGKPSRRNFLKLSAAVATGAGIAGTAEAQEMPPVVPAPDKPGFDHLVVIMFENRSFDSLLGYLYPPEALPAGETFDGVANHPYSNPGPNGPVPAHIYTGPTDTIMASPNPDPGEEYPHVNTQLFGTVDPPSNAHLNYIDMTAPFNAPPAGAAATMQGFVTDYINNFVATEGRTADGSRIRRRHGLLQPGDAAGDQHAGARVRGLRCLVLRRAVADLLQPRLLPRLHLLRLRHQQRQRGLPQMDGGEPGADDLQPPRGEGNLVGGLFRRQPGDLAHRPHQRRRAGALLEDELQADVTVLQGRGRRHPSRLRLHRAAADLRPQRHAPAGVVILVCGRRRQGGERRRELGRAGRREALERRLHGRPRQRFRDRLQRHEHHASGHLRRTRRHPRSRAAAGRDAAGGAEGHRDGLHLRPPRRARAGDRDLGVHEGRHDRPRRDAPCRGDRDALREIRAGAADRPRHRRARASPTPSTSPKDDSLGTGRRRRRNTCRRTRKPKARSPRRPAAPR